MFIRPFESFSDLRSGTVGDSVVRKEIDLLRTVGPRTGREIAGLRTASGRRQILRKRREIDRRWGTELDQLRRRLRQETADPDIADRIQIAVENHLIVAAQID